jgi:DMSO reductase anchor subunit
VKAKFYHLILFLIFFSHTIKQSEKQSESDKSILVLKCLFIFEKHFTMTLDLTRLIIDFGLFVLIWIVQLVIYPSFNYYSKENLFKWHRSYTKRFSFIVMPLMCSQLIIAIVQLFQTQNWFSILSIIIIVSLWIMTFKIFVPLHFSIDNNKTIEGACSKLVAKNWLRTALWTILFIISLLYSVY